MTEQPSNKARDLADMMMSQIAGQKSDADMVDGYMVAEAVGLVWYAFIGQLPGHLQDECLYRFVEIATTPGGTQSAAGADERTPPN